MPLTRVVQGWTKRLEYQLEQESSGQITNAALTAADTVKAWLYDKNRLEVSATSGPIQLVTASCGVVAYKASSTGVFTAARSPLTLRFYVRDAAGDVAFYPNEDPIRIEVAEV